jgi:Histidine biosynthesis protein
VKSVDGPVIAAGGIDRLERIERLTEAGVHAFTIATAVFDGSLELPLGVRGVRRVVAAIAALACRGARPPLLGSLPDNRATRQHRVE